MDYIRADENNIETEHICCAISNDKDGQVASREGQNEARFLTLLIDK